MLWKEKGVSSGSYMSFFNPPAEFKEHYYYMHSCGYFQCNSEYQVNDKGTRPPLFFYLINGSLHLDYNGSHFQANANDIILINCYIPQFYYCTDSCEFLFFHFDGNAAQSITEYLIERNQGPVFTIQNASTIYQIINEPIMKLCYQEAVSDAYLSAMVYSVLCQIEDNSVPSQSALSSYSDAVSQVIDFINKNIEKNLSLHDLASCANLSPFYFSRTFKKETGHSPSDYVSMCKINYAKLMLRTTTISITEIADFLNYSSTASFINAFKSRQGISPNKYRNQKSR